MALERKSWVAKLRAVRTMSDKGEGSDDSGRISEYSDRGVQGRDRSGAAEGSSSSETAEGSASEAAEGSGSASEAGAGSGGVEVVAVPLPTSPKHP